MDEICKVFDKIGEERRESVINGGVNLYKLKYENVDYRYKSLRNRLLNALYRNDMRIVNLEQTYLL